MRCLDVLHCSFRAGGRAIHCAKQVPLLLLARQASPVWTLKLSQCTYDAVEGCHRLITCPMRSDDILIALIESHHMVAQQYGINVTPPAEVQAAGEVPVFSNDQMAPPVTVVQRVTANHDCLDQRQTERARKKPRSDLRKLMS